MLNPAPSSLPELLAPAGNWECAHAAVENGADAIYFGLDKFNARMRAQNFTESDLPALMEFLHRRGVRGYVTFNTLIFQNELADAEQYLRSIIAAGVDAAIVQDVGVCRLIRNLSPDFPIHASTQMTVTSAAGIDFARELGCHLVVLARECSLKEITAIRRAQENGQSPTGSNLKEQPLPLEVFVHGALCVAYSGQCLTSEALGGRSANRGECAQACRMPYELICDGQLVSLPDRKYLLSPQDLAGLEVLPDLARIGVTSLKIEGRLKTPEYVASITRIYRQALDQLPATTSTVVASAPAAALSSATANAARQPDAATEDDRYEMEMAFSRGLSTGWFRGINNQTLVHARFGKKRGVYLGEVGRVQADRVIVKLNGPLKPGDGVVFDAGHPEGPEEGGRVYEVSELAAPQAKNQKPKTKADPRELALRFGDGEINFKRVHVGDKLWKTSDPELTRKLRHSFVGDSPRFQRALRLQVHGRAGQPLTLIARDELGNVVRVDSEMPLLLAEKQPLSEQRLREQLGRLGGTPFQLESLDNSLVGEVILPVRELNRIRRQAVTELEQRRAQPKRWTLREPQPPAARKSTAPITIPTGRPDSLPNRGTAAPQLIPLVRSLSQLEAVLVCSFRNVYCDFENPKKYRDAVRMGREKSAASGAAPAIWVAPPRIFKPGEEWILEQVRSCEPDGYLVRNYDHLTFFAGSRLVGDFSLNVANALAAAHFKDFGLERITAAYDLNATQLEALLEGAPPDWFEVTLHQHMPMFHMEHCVFCAFLSKGTDYTNCGRPCDRHEVRLRDRVGAEHLLKADLGCRNTVFNALAQTGAERAERLLARGARHFRVEFVNETAEQVTQTLARYGELLRGEITGTQLWRELKLLNQLGVTRGPSDKP